MGDFQKSRRDFIKTVGCLSVGFSFVGPGCFANNNEQHKYSNKNNTPVPDQSQIDSWLRVLENGRIEIITGKMELGQGIKTAIMQVAAEELQTDLGMVDIVIAETGYTPNEGYTAGSRSIESSAMSVRFAAATAREELLSLASKKLNVDVGQLEIKNAKIKSPDEEITFFELLDGQQIKGKIKQSVEVRGKTVRQIVGKSVPRQDIEDIIRAKPFYVHDLRFPDMVHARVIRPASYTSKLVSFDEFSVNDHPGLLKLVQIGSFLGVITEDEFQAVQLKEKAEKIAKWTSEDNLPSDVPLQDHIKTLPVSSEVDEKRGNWEEGIKNAAIRYTAKYFKPYIMHASNGPSCAVAIYKNDNLDVWTHSQGVYPLRRSLSSMLQISEDNIHVKGVPGSGCYGHNGADDVAAEAALLAINYPGKHIRLQWSREDEHGWEPYGTAMIMEIQAGISESGKIQGWKYDLWSDGHSTRPGGNANSLLPARFIDKGFGVPGVGYKGGAVRNALPYYTIDNLMIQSHIFQGPLRNSALRGLGAYANVFAIESFIDELALMAGKDPLDFRLIHLEDERAKECLMRLRQKVTIKPDEGEGIGFAFSRYKNSASYCAVAAYVNVNRDNGDVKVKKMWSVTDAGEIINPDGIKNQVEGGMLQSASWALIEEVKFDKQHITSTNWETYPIMRAMDAPEIEVEVIEKTTEPPLGVGETAQGPATAAILNAVFNATGIRIRELPINNKLLIKS